MDSSGLAVTLAVTAGAFGAVQVAVMGKLGERIGSLEAVLVAAIVTGVIVVPTLLVARRGLGGFGETLSQPWWMLTGGALGAFIVLSITIAGPRIGTTAVVGLLIAGQLIAATAIDRFEKVVDWPIEAVERSWAGLRSFAPDRLPVYGFDPAEPGFFWCVGQGGFGIQTAPAASRLAAAALLGHKPDASLAGIDPAAFSPERFATIVPR